MNKRYIFCVLLIFVGAGCVTDVKLAFPLGDRKVVIEGLLTDEKYDQEFWQKYLEEDAGNYVRLTYSNPLNVYEPGALAEDSSSFRHDEASYIRNALVIIHDDFGQIDTLKADSAQNEPFSGYYVPDKLIGIAGRNYYLDVWVEGEHYFASTLMESVPQLDSVGVEYIKRPIDKFSGYSPLFYFRKTSGKTQYYLTKVTNTLSFSDLEQPPPFHHFNGGEGGRLWNFSILSSELLPDYVNGASIALGNTSSTYFVGSLNQGETYDACLYSLTKEAYDYYAALINALKNDGGAYSPTPASPPSNIKGGALGFFNASAASIKSFTVPLF